VTRERLPQRAELPGLNGSGAAAVVPLVLWTRCISSAPNMPKVLLSPGLYHGTLLEVLQELIGLPGSI